MGAYTPLPWAPDGLVDEVLATVLQPTVDEMARRGTPFAGPAVRRPGADLARHPGRGVQRPLRRPGDPAAAGAARLLAGRRCCTAPRPARSPTCPRPAWRPGAAVAVVLASRGYPESSSAGDVITGLDAAEALDGVHVIHAGTAPVGDDLVTAGGRVLAVVGDRRRRRRGPGRGVRRGRRGRLRRRPAPHRHRRRALTRARTASTGSDGVRRWRSGPAMGETGHVLPTSSPPGTPAPTWPPIWSPEHKIVLERQLWIAVLEGPARPRDRRARRGRRGLRGRRRQGRPRRRSRPASGSPATT